jgi:hypothetical protein
MRKTHPFQTTESFLEPTLFYQQLLTAADIMPEPRYDCLSALHAQVLEEYLNRLCALDAHAAAQRGSDGRTIAQVVGHMAAWDRFTILAAGEMVAGIQWPGIMRMSGYKEPDGSYLEFESVDDFNAYQAIQHAAMPWREIRQQAAENAQALFALFTDRRLLPPQRLDVTAPHFWRLPDGTRLALPTGWYLWMVTLEHTAIEHVGDLCMADQKS